MLAWFNPFSGIAGDMALGACIDAGASVDEVIASLDSLGVDGWSMHAEAVVRGGLSATWVRVKAADGPADRRAGAIIDLVSSAVLPGSVAERAAGVFTRLAEVEGARHGVPPADVHFHEVGGVDAIVDVVGTCVALHLLGVEEVASGPVAVGAGTVEAAHGTLPVPAPAVVDLLIGAPIRRVDVDAELTTPTGAALLAGVGAAWGPIPDMTVVSVGYGAGTKDFASHPNVVQLVVGAPAPAGGAGEPLVELAANLDDATGEVLGHAISALLAAGALDAWVTPVVMKKGRPGHVVSALCRDGDAGRVSEVLMTETGSFGVRSNSVLRRALPRSFAVVDVGGYEVRVKSVAGRTKAEYDDAVAAAEASGRPLRDVIAEAERLAADFNS